MRLAQPDECRDGWRTAGPVRELDVIGRYEHARSIAQFQSTAEYYRALQGARIHRMTAECHVCQRDARGADHLSHRAVARERLHCEREAIAFSWQFDETHRHALVGDDALCSCHLSTRLSSATLIKSGAHRRIADLLAHRCHEIPLDETHSPRAHGGSPRLARQQGPRPSQYYPGLAPR